MAENYSSSAFQENSICSNTGEASTTSSFIMPTIGHANFETTTPYPELYVSQPDVLPPIIRKALTRVLQHNKKGFELLAR